MNDLLKLLKESPYGNLKEKLKKFFFSETSGPIWK